MSHFKAVIFEFDQVDQRKVIDYLIVYSRDKDIIKSKYRTWKPNCKKSITIYQGKKILAEHKNY